jgi:hypothetical protein
VTIDTLSTPPRQSAGSTGGSPRGGDRSSIPTGPHAEQFASLVAELGGNEGASGSKGQVPPANAAGDPADSQTFASIALAVVAATFGSGRARPGSDSGQPSAELESDPSDSEDPAAETETGAAVPGWVWTLAVLREVTAAGAPLSGAVAGEIDARETSQVVEQALDRARNGTPASTNAGSLSPIPGQDSRASQQDGLTGLPGVGLGRPQSSQIGPANSGGSQANPANPLGPPVGSATPGGPLPNQAGHSNQPPEPAGKLNGTLGVSTGFAGEPGVQQPAADLSLRPRGVAAADAQPHSQPAGGVAREGGNFAPPPISAGDARDQGSDEAPAGRGDRGYEQAPLPSTVRDAAMVSDLLRHYHGGASAEPVAPSSVVATAQPVGGAAIPVQTAAAIHASAVLDDADLRRQIVQGVRLQWRDGVGDAQMTLKPEYLGDVSISLRVERGVVTAHLNAAAAEVRAWMTTNEPMLRLALSEHGLTLDRLVVSEQSAESQPEADGRRPQNKPKQEEEQRRTRPERETGTFEIIV